MRSFLVAALVELVGIVLGVLLSPVIAVMGLIRRKHFFHADGHVFEAVITPPDDTRDLPEPVLPFVQLISGRGVIRLSFAIKRRPPPPGRPAKGNILGLSLQLGSRQWPQHLLLVTFRFRKPRTAANPLDFLDAGNVYASVLGHRLRQYGDVFLRVRVNEKRPVKLQPTEATAIDRLREALNQPQHQPETEHHLELELASAERPNRWYRVGNIRLLRELPATPTGPWSIYADPNLSPRPSPFAPGAGAGLRTYGFIAGVRRIVYPVSRWARRSRDPAKIETATRPPEPEAAVGR